MSVRYTKNEIYYYSTYIISVSFFGYYFFYKTRHLSEIEFLLLC